MYRYKNKGRENMSNWKQIKKDYENKKWDNIIKLSKNVLVDKPTTPKLEILKIILIVLGKNNTFLDLLDIETKTFENGQRVDIYLNDKYLRKFGSRFYNAWTKLGESLYNINFVLSPNETLNRLLLEEFRPFVSTDLKSWADKRAIRLSTFYFKPSPKLKHGNKYYSLLTEEEKRFFRGMGFKLLCFILRNLLNIGIIKRVKYIILEASGGKNKQETKRLVEYYKSLSFKTWTDDEKILEEEYEGGAVPMITEISNFMVKCVPVRF